MAYRTFIVPRHIYSGPGALESLSTVSGRRAFIVTDAIFRRLGIVAQVELEKTRDQGYARAKGEVLLGPACLAAPVFDRKGQVTAAISLSAALDELLEENETKYSTAVLETAGRISREMGFFPESAAYPL